MADVLKQLSFTKELTDVLKVAFPGLAEIAQKTEYEITISNDRKGLRLSCYVGAPIDLESDQPAQPIEIETIEIPVGELEEGVSIEDQEKALIEKALHATGGNRKAIPQDEGIRPMKAKYNLFGQLLGYLITEDEMKKLRKITRQAKGSQLKFDALAIFRDAGLLEKNELD